MTKQFFTPDGNVENQVFVTEQWLIDQWIGDQLFVWGSALGGLGDNLQVSRSTPVTTFSGGSSWKQCDASYNSNNYNNSFAAIKTDGTLWVWGYGIDGTLGTNNTFTVLTPITTFAGGNDWKQVSCGAAHMAAIKTDGTLWTWGRNSYGQLGANSNANIRATPITTFAGGNDWKQVSCGLENTAAIKTDGSLWIWGFNGNGLLGINQISSGTDFRATPVTTSVGGNDWKQVDCGASHIGAIKTDGSLWMWGRNEYCALGNNENSGARYCTPITTFAGGNNWKQISCDKSWPVTAAIKTDGSLWTWGYSYYGESGAGGGSNRRNICTPITTFAGGKNWRQVVAGTRAIKTDGTLWVWGRNSYGQLGTNNRTTYSSPRTTFAGGNNWKQVAGKTSTIAVTAGLDVSISPTLPQVTSVTGQVEYTTSGSYSWTCPTGVYDVSVVCVGGGGGGIPGNAGAGGGLGWKNNIPVTPGQSYTVVVGRAGDGGGSGDRLGGESYFITPQTVSATGGGGTSSVGVGTGDGGGNGGVGYWSGGGAAGYSGNGGSADQQAGQSGSGGGGGAYGTSSSFPGLNGGGVGIYGEGASGGPGQPGSGGSGQCYGGGGGCGNGQVGGQGGCRGAVRIIWGPGRAFPATNTGNL